MLTHGPCQAHVWLIFDVRQKNMDRDDERSKGLAALEVAARCFVGLIVLLGAAMLADEIHRGVIKGRHGVFAVSRSDDPVLFWLLVAAWVLLLAVLGYSAIRGFQRKSE